VADKSIISEALGRLRKEMRGRTGKKMVSGPSITIEIAHRPDAGAAADVGGETEPDADEKQDGPARKGRSLAAAADKTAAVGAPDVSDIVAKALRGGKK
jgi:hypothetical protein